MADLAEPIVLADNFYYCNPININSNTIKNVAAAWVSAVRAPSLQSVPIQLRCSHDMERRRFLLLVPNGVQIARGAEQ